MKRTCEVMRCAFFATCNTCGDVLGRLTGLGSCLVPPTPNSLSLKANNFASSDASNIEFADRILRNIPAGYFPCLCFLSFRCRLLPSPHRASLPWHRCRLTPATDGASHPAYWHQDPMHTCVSRILDTSVFLQHS